MQAYLLCDQQTYYYLQILNLSLLFTLITSSLNTAPTNPSALSSLTNTPYTPPKYTPPYASPLRQSVTTHLAQHLTVRMPKILTIFALINHWITPCRVSELLYTWPALMNTPVNKMGVHSTVKICL